AFALWDEEKGVLRLYRDRLGIKPLVYYADDENIYFGSEIRSILEAGIPRNPDKEGLSYYWYLGYIPAPYTAFEGVRKLKPGHYITVSNGEIAETRYWSLPEPEEGDKGEKYYRNELRDLLEDSVKRRLMADVPLGAFLSGGIDSSTVVGLMDKYSDNRVRTFSVAFKDEEYNESDYAQEVADYYDTNHTEYTVDLSTAEEVEKILAEFDEPVADPALIPTYLIAEKASDNVKLVNTGEGADELFGGYPRYLRNIRHWRRARYIPGPLKTLIKKVAELSPENTKPWFYGTYIGSMQSQAEHYSTMKTRGKDVPHVDRANIRKLVENTFDDRGDLLQNITAFDITYWLPDNLLYKVDHTTMLNGLEARVPFLDHRLVEFSRRVPTAYKVENGKEKAILRKAMSDILPNSIQERDKSGFGVPNGRWMKEGSLSDHFTYERFEDIPILDEDTVMKRYEEFCQGNNVHSYYLWKALNLQIWYEEWVEP
ncbi:MAG: asparagine synthase (glutamine-hydrolyzing), partial [Candidatus Aenigmatarchaeota archaeon]